MVNIDLFKMTHHQYELFNQDSYRPEGEGIQEDFENPEQQLNNLNTKQQTTTTKFETIKINEEDINYKNFPKMIGNNIVKWIKKYKFQSKDQEIPKGLKNLIELRDKEKQSKIKIKDLRDSIILEEESQSLFKEYIADQLYLDLIFSNKVADPFSYIPGISNYYSAAQEPEKMKGNYILRKEFINQ